MAIGPVELETVWQNVIDKWEDPARHDAFVSVATQHGQLAWAAARYKEKAGDPIADKQMERVRKAATATMFATASRKPSEEAPYRRTIVIFLVLLVMMFIGLFGVKILHDTKPHDPVPRPPPTTPARP